MKSKIKQKQLNFMIMKMKIYLKQEKEILLSKKKIININVVVNKHHLIIMEKKIY